MSPRHCKDDRQERKMINEQPSLANKSDMRHAIKIIFQFTYLNVLAWQAKLRAISVTIILSFVGGPMATVVSAKIRADKMSIFVCVYFLSPFNVAAWMEVRHMVMRSDA